jgi:hypothetical protein
MTVRHFSWVAILTAAFFLGGCPVEPIATPDGGSNAPADAGLVMNDAGGTVDAGPEPDAGPVLDAGNASDAAIAMDSGTLPDAGMVVDGGVPDSDASLPASADSGVDAGGGFVGVDSGSDSGFAPLDSGGSPPDAGPAGIDASAPDVDSGLADLDAGYDGGVVPYVPPGLLLRQHGHLMPSSARLESNGLMLMGRILPGTSDPMLTSANLTLTGRVIFTGP